MMSFLPNLEIKKSSDMVCIIIPYHYHDLTDEIACYFMNIHMIIQFWVSKQAAQYRGVASSTRAGGQPGGKVNSMGGKQN